jgi:hypothetical protein
MLIELASRDASLAQVYSELAIYLGIAKLSSLEEIEIGEAYLSIRNAKEPCEQNLEVTDV